ncbi:MAG: hypothetical protein GX800_02140 [Clostridiaceae bacterium]|jgi:hypothetical protein|nr:hypothetical protein [Clostridiaceae bacterium]
MTNRSAKKVIIISGIKSENFEQAIFILKDKRIVPFQKTIIDEAEEIIQRYIRQIGLGQNINTKTTKHRWFKRKK